MVTAALMLILVNDVPAVPPRNYSEEVLVVRAEEAIVVQVATAAMLEYLKKHPKLGPLSNYYLGVEFQAPSVWRATWSLNSQNARGGSISFILDPAGRKVVFIQEDE